MLFESANAFKRFVASYSAVGILTKSVTLKKLILSTSFNISQIALLRKLSRAMRTFVTEQNVKDARGSLSM